MTSFRFLAPIIACLVVLLSGCGNSTNPQEDFQLSSDKTTMINNALVKIEAASRSVCKKTLPKQDCDLTAEIAPASDDTVNAYQVRGKPLIIFTEPMLAMFKNEDEFAFVYAHEAAHYILQHGDKRLARSAIGAILLGGLAATQTQNTKNQGKAIADWASLGMLVGNRIYSPQEELEADQLGAEIALAAGFNPIVGIRIFERLEDNNFPILPSHPKNNKRIAAIDKHFANR